MSARRAVALMALLALAVTAALPACSAVGRSRELAARTKDAASLRLIAKACMVYANENRGAYPPHLAVLIASGAISPDELVSAKKLTAPGTFGPTKDWKSIVADVDAHCDWVYVGAGLSDTSDSSQMLVYTKDIYVNHEGRNVAFADGHIEFIRGRGVETLMPKVNEERSRRKLPPLAVDASAAIP